MPVVRERAAASSSSPQCYQRRYDHPARDGASCVRRFCLDADGAVDLSRRASRDPLRRGKEFVSFLKTSTSRHTVMPSPRSLLFSRLSRHQPAEALRDCLPSSSYSLPAPRCCENLRPAVQSRSFEASRGGRRSRLEKRNDAQTSVDISPHGANDDIIFVEAYTPTASVARKAPINAESHGIRWPTDESAASAPALSPPRLQFPPTLPLETDILGSRSAARDSSKGAREPSALNVRCRCRSSREAEIRG